MELEHKYLQVPDPTMQEITMQKATWDLNYLLCEKQFYVNTSHLNLRHEDIRNMPTANIFLTGHNKYIMMVLLSPQLQESLQESVLEERNGEKDSGRKVRKMPIHGTKRDHVMNQNTNFSTRNNEEEDKKKTCLSEGEFYVMLTSENIINFFLIVKIGIIMITIIHLQQYSG